jgi:hypothetical protein
MKKTGESGLSKTLRNLALGNHPNLPMNIEKACHCEAYSLIAYLALSLEKEPRPDRVTCKGDVDINIY